MQAVGPAVENAIGRDLGAEVPPGKAFGCSKLDRRIAVPRAAEDRGILEAPIEEGAIRVVVWPGSLCRRGGKGHPAEPAQGPGHLGLAAIGSTPAVLQRRLAQA